MEGCGSYVQQDVTVQMSISVRMKTRSQKLVKVMKGTTLQILAGSGLSVSFRANRNHLFCLQSYRLGRTCLRHIVVANDTMQPGNIINISKSLFCFKDSTLISIFHKI